jgi:hypothetical protein
MSATPRSDAARLTERPDLVPAEVAQKLERQLTQARALLADALDLAPRMSDDDPIAPALADWCWRARAALR